MVFMMYIRTYVPRDNLMHHLGNVMFIKYESCNSLRGHKVGIKY